MNGWMDGSMMNEWVDGWMDEGMGGCIDGWINEWMVTVPDSSMVPIPMHKIDDLTIFDDDEVYHVSTALHQT